MHCGLEGEGASSGHVCVYVCRDVFKGRGACVILAPPPGKCVCMCICMYLCV